MAATRMKAPHISDSEWTVMEALWENSPQTASAVAKALQETTGWAENTVRTLLTRLLEKRALVIVDPGVQPKCYAPAVKRDLPGRLQSERKRALQERCDSGIVNKVPGDLHELHRNSRKWSGGAAAGSALG